MTADWRTYPVTIDRFRAALSTARALRSIVAESTSTASEMPEAARYWLTADAQSGYGVTHDGELIGVFSLVKGRGSDLVWQAIVTGYAMRLDCFDGFLPAFYAGLGFRETYRVANYVKGGPDVVYMGRV